MRISNVLFYFQSGTLFTTDSKLEIWSSNRASKSQGIGSKLTRETTLLIETSAYQSV